MLDSIFGHEGLGPSIKLARAVCTDDAYFETWRHDAPVGMSVP